MGSRTHVVILNWNGRRYVQDCLDSIFAQTYGDAKILVVDNGSTDGSAEFIRDEFPEAVLIALPENVHFARGTNAGVEVALQDPACEFVVTLNNDTRSDPEFLADLVKAAAEERVGMVAAKLLFMDRPTILNRTIRCSTSREGSPGTECGCSRPCAGESSRGGIPPLPRWARGAVRPSRSSQRPPCARASTPMPACGWRSRNDGCGGHIGASTTGRAGSGSRTPAGPTKPCPCIDPSPPPHPYRPGGPGKQAGPRGADCP